jgi:DNA primase small subunit
VRRNNKPDAVWPQTGEKGLSETASIRNTAIVKNAFREYYFHSKSVEEPTRMEQREFGYSLFGQKGWIRHLSFSSMGALVATLVKEAPSDVYCSNAYYRFPTHPMQEKDWLGAFLIFDIDGKDLDLPCVPSHTYLLCAACRSAEPLHNQQSAFACRSCGANKADSVSIPCAKCIDASKKELKKLMGFLTGDIGIDQLAIRTYFSGNNGFHIHVSDDQFVTLDSSARSDLAGYLLGTGLLPESVGVRKGNNGSLCVVKFPRGGIAYGWRNKLAEKLKIDGSSPLKLQHIVTQAGGYSAFKSSLDRTAREMGVKIDAQVTTDVHRIFRMPGTLNGKSGLAKTVFINPDSFDPFRDSCVLGDNTVNVKLKCPVRLRLKGRSFTISKESAELPAYAAVFLICKGLAEAC